MVEEGSRERKWFDNPVLELAALLFVWPLGVYGLVKNSWNRTLKAALILLSLPIPAIGVLLVVVFATTDWSQLEEAGRQARLERAKKEEKKASLSLEFERGVEAHEDGRPVEARELWLPIAEAGHLEAQHRVGSLFFLGKGVEQDCAQALEWYERAALGGRKEAQYDLGRFHDRGECVDQNSEEALEWFLRAAKQDYALAQNEIGRLYLKGRGVEKDPEKALVWFLQAAQGGETLGKHNAGLVYLGADGMPQDLRRAVHWLRQAAEEGFAASQYELGVFLWKGEGLAQNRAEALRWWRTAAANGHQKAQRLTEPQGRLGDVVLGIQMGWQALDKATDVLLTGDIALVIDSVLAQHVIYSEASYTPGIPEAQVAVKREAGRAYRSGQRMSEEDLYVITGAQEFSTVLGARKMIVTAEQIEGAETLSLREFLSLAERIGVVAFCGQQSPLVTNLSVADLRGRVFSTTSPFTVEGVVGGFAIYSSESSDGCQIAVERAAGGFYAEGQWINPDAELELVSYEDFSTVTGSSKMIPVFRQK